MASSGGTLARLLEKGLRLPFSHEHAAGFSGLKALSFFGVGISGLISFSTIASADAADSAEHGLPAPNYPWPHKGILHDASARGPRFQHDCAACHGMGMSLRQDAADAAYTGGGTNVRPAEIEVANGPTGGKRKTNTCPAKICPRFLEPIKFPVGLDSITKAPQNNQNSVFALLTSRAAVPVGECLPYPPLYAAGAIAICKTLTGSTLHSKEASPITEAKMGKDVVAFLSWAA